MIDFINEILSGDLVEILGEDLYAPTVACVAASWAVLSFAALVETVKHTFVILFNLKVR